MMGKRATFLVLFAVTVILLGTKISFSQSSVSLPSPQSHPLPPSLAQWEVKADVGDYFSEIEASPLGYLVWSDFPVKVYLDVSVSGENNQGIASWTEAVMKSVREWDVYLPMEPVAARSVANIIIARSRPPLNTTRNPETGMIEFSRARNARTRYKFGLHNQQLIHQMIIEISPHQSRLHTEATARHEIGHALGIWGHSPNPKDALYFSQVRDSPKISPRDLNTLKKIYQQPTRLGWKIMSSSNVESRDLNLN